MYIVYIPFTLYCGEAAARAQPKRARYVYLAPLPPTRKCVALCTDAPWWEAVARWVGTTHYSALTFVIAPCHRRSRLGFHWGISFLWLYIITFLRVCQVLLAIFFYFYKACLRCNKDKTHDFYKSNQSLLLHSKVFFFLFRVILLCQVPFSFLLSVII